MTPEEENEMIMASMNLKDPQEILATKNAMRLQGVSPVDLREYMGYVQETRSVARQRLSDRQSLLMPANRVYAWLRPTGPTPVMFLLVLFSLLLMPLVMLYTVPIRVVYWFRIWVLQKKLKSFGIWMRDCKGIEITAPPHEHSHQS